MDSGSDVIHGKKGQTVCRPSTWIDVLLFFAFNYGLHVFTMLSPPGSSPFFNLTTAMSALLLPYSGILVALKIIRNRGKRGASGDLQIAHRAGALCMLIRPDQECKAPSKYVISPTTKVHGQYPYTTSSVPGDNNESAPPPIGRLLLVPKTFTVNPPRNSSPTPFALTYNYNVLKSVAGIVQILSGSFGLYRVSERQLPRLGCAAYSLTVVPYIIMSIVNLLATLCEPQYPSMFLVMYRGPLPKYPSPGVEILPVPTVFLESAHEIASVTSEQDVGPAEASDPLEAHVFGAVGEAYGDLTALDRRLVSTPGAKSRCLRHSVIIGGLLCIAAPYLIIQLLTNFQPGQSSPAQRQWLMAWLVIGQLYGAASVVTRLDYQIKDMSVFGKSVPAEIRPMFSIMIAGTAAIGGFAVVGQMIMDDEICTVI